MNKGLNLNSFSALIGIDWADQKHDYCLLDNDTKTIEYSKFLHQPAAIEIWVHSLRKRFNGQKIAIALELKTGPLVYALLRHDFIVIVPISPQALAKYRSVFTQSGAKDDPTDAYLALDFLTRHTDKLKAINPDTAETRILQRLVEHRRLLVEERVRVTNRITAALKEYYPQVLNWFDEIDTLMFCDFVETWPNLQKAQKTREKTYERFFHSHNSRSRTAFEKRLQGIIEACSLTEDEGVIIPNQKFVLLQIKLLRELINGIKTYDREIAIRFKEHKDFEIFDSLPGAGKVYAPRLLAAMGSNRDRFQSSDELVRQVGVAPVVERSGKKTWIHWRYSCSTFVRQTFVEWSNHSIKYSYWAKTYYDQQRLLGKGHQAVLRSLAFKWARILYRCWKNNERYDEAKYLLVLKEKNSPLLAKTPS